MPRRISLIALFFSILTLTACGGAAPQLIGSYPSTDGSNTYQPPGGPESQLAITYNATFEIEVRNTNRAVDDMKRVAAGNGGYLLSSRTWSRGNDLFGEAIIAVPSSNFDNAQRDVRYLGEVLSEGTTGELEYVGGNGGSFSNITVSFQPESANWGKKAGSVFQGLLIVLAVSIPPILMVIGAATVAKAIGDRIKRRMSK